MTIVFIQTREELSLNLCTAVLEELCRQKNYPYLVKRTTIDWSREDSRANADELWYESRTNRVLVPLSAQFNWRHINSWLNECGFIEDPYWQQNIVFLEVIDSESEAKAKILGFNDNRIFYQLVFLPRSSRFTPEDLWHLWLFQGSWRDLCQRNSPLPYRIKESLQKWSIESIEAFDRANIINPVSIDVRSLTNDRSVDAIDW